MVGYPGKNLYRDRDEWSSLVIRLKIPFVKKRKIKIGFGTPGQNGQKFEKYLSYTQESLSRRKWVVIQTLRVETHLSTSRTKNNNEY